MNKKPKVYVLGDARGFYRVQNVVKYLVDRPKEFRFSFNNYLSNSRPIKYLKSILINTFHVIFSNVIYVCVLNVDVDILYELFIAFIFRKKIVCDYYISIYEKVVVDEGWFKEGSILAKLAKKLDRYYMRVSTKVVFLSEYEKERYCEMLGIKKNDIKHIVIPHVIEEKFKVACKEHKSFNICWWGSYLPLHGLDLLFEAAKILYDEGLDVHWFFFGNNDEKGKEYVDKARTKGIIDICTFENSYTMKNGKLVEFLKDNCDLALGNFGTSTKARSLMSNKVLDACAMKTLVLSGNATAYYSFFDGENDIFLCECDENEIAKSIKKIVNLNSDERKERIERAYVIFQQQFSVNVFSDRMTDLFSNLRRK